MKGFGTNCRQLRDELQGKYAFCPSQMSGLMFVKELTEFAYLLAGDRDFEIKAFNFKKVGRRSAGKPFHLLTIYQTTSVTFQNIREF